MTLSIDIQWLDENLYSKIEIVQDVTNLINQAFSSSEKGIWKNEVGRTSIKEVATFIKNKEILLAKFKEEIVGCAHVRAAEKDIGGFGMLSVDEKYKKMGIATEVVNFIEQWYQQQSFQKIQLELLMPQKSIHPSKEMLKNWYERIGYQLISNESFENSYEHLAQKLAIPCELVIFQKSLK